MIVFAKRSGESLNAGATAGEPWTRLGREQTVSELRTVSEYVRTPNEQDVTGAVFVVGAGNLAMRGELLQRYGVSPAMGDQMGMVGTLWNAQVLAQDLRAAGIGSRLLIARGVGYDMPDMEKIEVCTPDTLCDAFMSDELAVIGGGSGKTGQTTDAAIIDHALEFRAVTDVDVRVLKGTKHAGVYDADPATNYNARLLSRVSASRMRDEGWTAVDPRCLDLIEQHGMEMRVHAASEPLFDAVAGKVGTLIVPQSGVLEYAQAQ